MSRISWYATGAGMLLGGNLSFGTGVLVYRDAKADSTQASSAVQLPPPYAVHKPCVWACTEALLESCTV